MKNSMYPPPLPKSDIPIYLTLFLILYLDYLLWTSLMNWVAS